MDILPTELVRIINDYKLELEQYDKKLKKIKNFINNIAEDIPHMNDSSMFESLKIDIDFNDIKNILLDENIYHIKYKINIYGNNHSNNNKLWSLNLLNNIKFLNDCNVKEIIYSKLSGIFYLDIRTNDIIYNTETKTNDCETYDITTSDIISIDDY